MQKSRASHSCKKAVVRGEYWMENAGLRIVLRTLGLALEKRHRPAPRAQAFAHRCARNTGADHDRAPLARLRCRTRAHAPCVDPGAEHLALARKAAFLFYLEASFRESLAHASA